MIFVKDFEKTAIKYENNDISYTHLIKKAKSYGKKLNIELEDRIIIFVENRPELLYAFLGIWDKKGTCVCLDESFDSKSLEYYLKDADAKYMFTSSKNLETARSAIEAAKIDIELLVVDEIIEEDEIEKGTNLESPEKDAVALMLYTSGTTGDPKGVMLTYDNILANIEGLDTYEMYKKEDVVLAVLPMHHIFPLLGAGIIPLSKGGTIVFLKEVSKAAIGECLKNNGITMIIGVPRLYEMFHKGIMDKIKSNRVANILFKICEKLQNLDLSKKIFKKVHEGFGGKIKCFVSGGSKLEPQVARDFLTLGIEVVEGYGMTETAPMITFTPLGSVAPGSAGYILPGTELRIADDGEIQTKGRHVMKGYFNKPEATAEMVVDGWLSTGDLGEMKDEKLYVTGRKKEMIVLSNGKNINPLEIEAYIMKNTNLVEEVAVTEYEDLLTAVVYPNIQKMREEGATNILETLKWGVIDDYNSKAPSYRKVLKTIVVGEELPKTKLGKIKRFMLKEFLDDISSEEEDVQELEFEEYKMLAGYLKELKGKKGIAPSAHLELDLGLDSLELIEILSYLEQTFGIKSDEEILLEYSTVEKLANYIKENRGNIVSEEVNWKDILTHGEKKPLPKPIINGGVINALTYLPLKHYVDIRVNGMENLKKIGNKPCIFVGNHQSLLDGFMINSILPKEIRKKTFYLAINIHFEGRIKSFVAENGNIILVNLNKNIKESLQKAAEILESGGNLVIFPEGARTRDGNIGPFKKTFSILAKELDIPVIPFGIKGAYDVLPYGAKHINKGSVEINFLEEEVIRERSSEKFTTDIENKIKKMVEGI